MNKKDNNMKAKISKAAGIAVIALCLVTSCKKEDLMTYNGKAQVYFNFANEILIQDRIDSTLICFGYDDPVKTDSTIRIRVKIMGNAVNYDRPINIELVDTLSTAKMGEDVEFLSAQSRILADSIGGWVWLKIKHTPKLTETTMRAVIRTVPNEHFYADYEQIRYESEPKRKKANVFWLYFNGTNEMPNLWAARLSSFTQVFGTYSRVKLEFMCEVLGLTREYFMYDPETEKVDEVYSVRIASYTLAWTIILNRRLNQYEAEHGERLKDEYGNEIKMGSSLS